MGRASARERASDRASEDESDARPRKRRDPRASARERGTVTDADADVEPDAVRASVDVARTSNDAYVGVRDVDVDALTQTYARGEERAREALGERADALTREERDRLVSEVMRYVLFSSHRERGAPVQRAKIAEAISALGGAGGRNVRAGSYVVATAQRKFLEIFGFEMMECSRAQSKNKRPAKTTDQANAAAAKCYALKSVLPAQMRRKFVDDPKAAAARGLAIVVAALIQISSGCIREDALHEHLKALGISNVKAPHGELGDVEGLLQSLVKRRVFMRERTSPDDPTAGYSYELAEGADVIIGCENIDKFVHEIMRAQVTVA